MKIVKHFRYHRKALLVFFTDGSATKVSSSQPIEVMLNNSFTAVGFAWDELVRDETNNRLSNDLVTIEYRQEAEAVVC